MQVDMFTGDSAMKHTYQTTLLGFPCLVQYHWNPSVKASFDPPLPREAECVDILDVTIQVNGTWVSVPDWQDTVDDIEAETLDYHKEKE
jgi:hypothetical protein